jgi:hypothetical protein
VFFGNDWCDVATAKPIADPRHVVTLVASQPERTSTWTAPSLWNANRVND